jgi:hypothetical protein
MINLRVMDKFPRKLKKKILGRLLSKTQLKKLLSQVKLGEPIRTMYDRRSISPYAFCPKCGCRHYYGTGNLTCYPEHWERFHCLRCNNIVGYIDNSPFIHALECADDNYDPTF